MRVNMLSTATLLAILLTLPPVQAAPAADTNVPEDVQISGVVSRVHGGRVTVRLDSGRADTYSVSPGTVAEGDRITASVRRNGDALRLERVKVQPR
tara:strand:+ start:1053 stop:1340 length:288 start_codon:yes stop_codon:yes gene_type:complete